MATENVKLKVDVETGQAAKSLTDLKKEFKELQTQLASTKVGTKEYIDTLKKLGETKDDIGDLRGQIDALGSNAAKFKAVGNVVQGVAGGFAAASSAAALFGGEAEEVQKAMVKVQAALALQQGISAILELGDAFKALKIVILANPIFLIAAIIAAIVGYFVGLTNIMDGVKAGFKAVGEAASSVFNSIVDGIKYAIDLYTQYLDLLTFGLLDINDAYKGYLKSIDDANKAEAERLAQQKKIIDEAKKLEESYLKQADLLAKKQAVMVEAFDKEIALAKAAGEDTEAREKEKLEFVRKSLEEQIKFRLKALEQERIIIGAAENDLDIRGIQAKKRLGEQKKILSELQKAEKENNFAIEMDAAEKRGREKEAGREAYEEKLKQDEEYLKNKKELEELYAEEDRKFREQAGKEYLEYLKTLGEEEVIINTDVLDQTMAANEAATLVENDNVVKQTAFDKQAAEQRIGLAVGTLQTLASLTELFGKKNEANAKKAFEINKALNIATALVQTYQSATAAYASQLSIPTPDAPIRAAVAAGIAIAAGLANVAKIASTKFESKTASGGGGGGGASAPSVNSPSSQGNNSIGTTLLNRQAIEQGQQPTENRVFVVESDMTATQRRVGGIRNRATVVE